MIKLFLPGSCRPGGDPGSYEKLFLAKQGFPYLILAYLLVMLYFVHLLLFVCQDREIFYIFMVFNAPAYSGNANGPLET